METNSVKSVNAKSIYYQEWRKKNPGKNAEYCKRYWERKEKERQEQLQTNQETKTESA